MLLTLLWGSSLILGRCDLVEAYGGRVVAKDRTLTKGWSLTGILHLILVITWGLGTLLMSFLISRAAR